MLDSIRSLDGVLAGDAVHITRQELATVRRCRALELEARRRARDLLDEAHSQAEAIQAAAFAEGYGEGVMQVAVDLARGLCESQRLADQLHEQMAEAVRQLLKHLLDDPRWFDEMLEHWLAEQADATRMTLQVLLPLRYRGRVAVLREQLEGLGVQSVKFEFADQERHVVRLGEQLFEFELEAAREQLAPRLLNRLAGLPDSVRELDERARQTLARLVSSFTGAGMPPPTGADDAD
ncbi:HrpE/YscL family type III secretion apparatus protein [Pseudomonas asplenii]|uniref:HrpE/YscL family type III secretion apparatus protein n=1 Tax=Pseudomonas asplenii TaxID=53407 RepID=UPI000476F8C0|nr:HrpE/YscL family type III secretion apparatus protein [Pseudomonas fuscovaginae]